MKIKSTIVAGLMTGALVLASNSFAAPTEVELMKQAKITRPQAEKIALAKVPHGTIKSGEIEREKGRLVWSFDIAKANTPTITEVLIDAKTAKIISVQKENSAEQAAEEKADRKKKD